MRALFAVAALASLCGIAGADSPPVPRILWLTGQSELALEGKGVEGADAFGTALRKAFPGWHVESASLGSLKAPVPEGTILVIAGPLRDLSDAETATLRAILASDVRLLVCIDPEKDHSKSALPHFRATLREAGVEVGADRLVDLENQRLKTESGDRVTFAATFSRGDHPVHGLLLAGAEILFSNACRVAAMAGPKDPWDIREIATTGKGAFGQGIAGGTGPAGPVLVAAERRGGTGRLVVAGDSTFLTNGFAAMTGQKDSPLGIAALQWLAQGIRMPAPERKADETVEEGEPLVLVVAICGAILLVVGAAVFGKKG